MNKKDRELFLSMLDLYEFELYVNDNGLLQLYDLQGACLGDICSDEFRTEFEVIGRLEVYHEDYLIRDLEEQYDISFYYYDDWVEFLEEQNDNENEYTLSLLKLIVKGE